MKIHLDKPSADIRLNHPLSPKYPSEDSKYILMDVGDYNTDLNIPRLPEGNIYKVIISYPSQKQNEEEGGDYLYCRVDDDVYLWRDDYTDSD